MAVTVEDGSGVAGADSYVTATEFDTFIAAYFGAAMNGAEADKEAALRRACAYMNGLNWTGSKTHGRNQALAWPRAWMADEEGWAVQADEIPVEVKDAQNLLARAELTDPGVLSPSFTASTQKTLVEVKGIRWQAPAVAATAQANRKVVTDAMDRIKGFLRAGYGAVRVERA